MGPRWLSLATLLVLQSLSSNALAYDEWRRDAWMLPTYCQDRVNWASPNSRWNRWQGFFGNVAIHMSHYCNGVYAEMMAKRSVDITKRNLFVAQAAEEMAYVSRDCDPKCVIYGDLHRRWGWALIEQGKIVEGTKHLRLAESVPRRVIPNVPPPPRP